MQQPIAVSVHRLSCSIYWYIHFVAIYS